MASREERLAQADRFGRRVERLEEFVTTATVLLALIPLAYGVLTWVYGRELWNDSLVYSLALETPGAPQSWGAVFIATGVVTVISAWRGHRKCLMVTTAITALLLATFMSMFVTQFIQHTDQEGALAPAVIYGVLSMVFLARSRMAWASLKDG
jgi:FlaA1/EpsC-like NDP-sugar epimerase